MEGGACEKSRNVGDTVGVFGLGANGFDGHNCVLYKRQEGVLGTISHR